MTAALCRIITTLSEADSASHNNLSGKIAVKIKCEELKSSGVTPV